MSDAVASPSRRAFLQRFTQAPEAPLPESVHPRPPWARDNKEFLALCTRCHHCIDACPQRVLQASDESDDLLKGLPILSLDYGSCDFCNLCVDSCPEGALSQKLGVRHQAVAKVNDHCQLVYGQHCSLCVENCEVQAISISAEKRIQVDSDLCTGCGECALGCYDRAIEMVKK